MHDLTYQFTTNLRTWAILDLQASSFPTIDATLNPIQLMSGGSRLFQLDLVQESATTKHAREHDRVVFAELPQLALLNLAEGAGDCTGYDLTELTGLPDIDDDGILELCGFFRADFFHCHLA